MIPDPGEDGKSSADIADRLIRVGQLNESYPRRAVNLRCEGVPIPAERLQAAMQAVIPTIRQPVGKMKRILHAHLLLSAPDVAALSGQEQKQRLQEGWQPPKPGQWRGIIRLADCDVIQHRSGPWCYFAGLMRSDILGPYAIPDIFQEEAAILTAIRDVAITNALREQSTSEIQSSGE